jgi:hypothetical protein
VADVTRSFLSGLELSQLFYTEVVAPILEKALDEVPYSAALIGWGSEVQGLRHGALHRPRLGPADAAFPWQ